MENKKLKNKINIILNLIIRIYYIKSLKKFYKKRIINIMINLIGKKKIKKREEIYKILKTKN